MKTWSDKITGSLGSTASIVVHTLFFIAAFALPFFGIPLDRVLLVLTTAVSLEAIYLALFIQITVNRTAESIEDIEEDIEEVQKDVGEIGEDIDEITEDLEEVQEDLGEIQEDDKEDDLYDQKIDKALIALHEDLAKIMAEIERLKEEKKN